MSLGKSQLQSSQVSTSCLNRLRKHGSYEWKVNFVDKNMKSPNFYPLGSENKWFLLLTDMLHDYVTVRFRSHKRTDCFAKLEFFVNRHRLSNLISGYLCGDYIIHRLSKGRFFLKFDPEEGCCGTVRIEWSLANIYCGSESLCQELIINLYSVFETGKFNDLFIETKDGSEIPVHRAILSARSPVFRAMLENDMLEAKTHCIKIMDFSPETVKNMVNFLYTSDTPEYSFESATDLLRIADRYELTSLKYFCARILISNLSESNTVELLLLADVHAVNDLKAKALKIISKNELYFADRDKLKLLKQRPELLLDVIISNSRNR